MITLSLAKLVLLFVLGAGAGALGAWIGIGGGVVLVPALVLGFGIDMKAAIATSLVAVIVTSTAAGSVYVGRGLTNTRLAIALEIATTLGGVAGSLIALAVPSRVLAGVFAVVMAVTAALTFRKSHAAIHRPVDPTAGEEQAGEEAGRLAGTYFDERRGGLVAYRARRFWAGSAVALLAGSVSGLLGVGGGFLKVPAMNLAMDVPIKVAVATSNFMIGVTAAASVFTYFGRGWVYPLLTAPVALGVLAGALVGTVRSGRAEPNRLRAVLAIVLILVAAQMGLRALGISLGS
jgi:uncharacterized membrane protein YfcA